METIKNYLDNMFQSFPETNEIFKLKQELFTNMEEKYEELKESGKSENEAIGIVISEFGNIEELLREMDIKPAFLSIDPESACIELDEAKQFIYAKTETAKLIAFGVSLILVGVAFMLYISDALLNSPKVAASFKVSKHSALPVVFLLITVAVGTILFIYSGIHLTKYKYIEEGRFSLAPTIHPLLTNELNIYRPKQTLIVIISVILCILSPLAILLNLRYGTCILLLIIAIAVYLLIRFCVVTEAYEQLLKINDFTPNKRKESKLIALGASIVFPLATCIYLVWSFVYSGWKIAWIVFVVAGILFGIFAAVCSICSER